MGRDLNKEDRRFMILPWVRFIRRIEFVMVVSASGVALPLCAQAATSAELTGPRAPISIPTVVRMSAHLSSVPTLFLVS